MDRLESENRDDISIDVFLSLHRFKDTRFHTDC